MASSSSSQNQTFHPRFYVCDCGEKMFVRTSWTEKNPARRFVKCPDVKSRFCVRYRFLDDELSDYYKKIIYDLRMQTINQLTYEQLEREDTEKNMELLKMLEELTLVKSKLKMFDFVFMVLIRVVAILCAVLGVLIMK